ncbi:hypothetical protein ACC717_37140, partial [Rhizobium ruizarguesonis]
DDLALERTPTGRENSRIAASDCLAKRAAENILFRRGADDCSSSPTDAQQLHDRHLDLTDGFHGTPCADETGLHQGIYDHHRRWSN